MKDLVEIIAKSLVDHPEQISVTETEKDDIIKVELTVAPEDMGKVIGKQGRIAKSIRTVVKAAASKGDKKVIVDIKKYKDLFGGVIITPPFLVIVEERYNFGRQTESGCDHSTAWYQGRGKSISDNG